MKMWSKGIPALPGLYWWRETPDDEPEPVQIERSGHKPPYWYSWGLCGPDDCPNHMSLNLNYKGNGPVEEGYEYGETFRGGEWFSGPIRPLVIRNGVTLVPVSMRCVECGSAVYEVTGEPEVEVDGHVVGDAWCPKCSAPDGLESVRKSFGLL